MQPSSSDTSLLPHRGECTMTIEQCIAAWLHAKAHRSESKKTAKAYQETLAQFQDLPHWRRDGREWAGEGM